MESETSGTRDREQHFRALIEEYRSLREDTRSNFRNFFQVLWIIGAVSVGGLTIAKETGLNWILIALPYLLTLTLILGVWQMHLSLVISARIRCIEREVSQITGYRSLLFEDVIADRLTMPFFIRLDEKRGNEARKVVNPLYLAVILFSAGVIMIGVVSGVAAYNLFPVYGFVIHVLAISGLMVIGILAALGVLRTRNLLHTTIQRLSRNAESS